mmetsp:Transcript_24218/g.21509  ORF Transcript_24218/g.21509 Transcript_24218/m.21509 type:complete len:81 (+) Transcript_24218:236-478(+)
MKAFEEKFYERYLSNGYKLCACDICAKLVMKFLIKEDKDPNDFYGLHYEYLKKKASNDKIELKGEIYQNHTIIFLNKAGI